METRNDLATEELRGLIHSISATITADNQLTQLGTKHKTLAAFIQELQQTTLQLSNALEIDISAQQHIKVSAKLLDREEASTSELMNAMDDFQRELNNWHEELSNLEKERDMLNFRIREYQTNATIDVTKEANDINQMKFETAHNLDAIELDLANAPPRFFTFFTCCESDDIKQKRALKRRHLEMQQNLNSNNIVLITRAAISLLTDKRNLVENKLNDLRRQRPQRTDIAEHERSVIKQQVIIDEERYQESFKISRLSTYHGLRYIVVFQALLTELRSAESKHTDTSPLLGNSVVSKYNQTYQLLEKLLFDFKCPHSFSSTVEHFYKAIYSKLKPKEQEAIRRDSKCKNLDRVIREVTISSPKLLAIPSPSLGYRSA